MSIQVSATDQARLETVMADRPQKRVRRAKIIQTTAEVCGTAEMLAPGCPSVVSGVAETVRR
jgi:hypothetical protein